MKQKSTPPYSTDYKHFRHLSPRLSRSCFGWILLIWRISWETGACPLRECIQVLPADVLDGKAWGQVPRLLVMQKMLFSARMWQGQVLTAKSSRPGPSVATICLLLKQAIYREGLGKENLQNKRTSNHNVPNFYRVPTSSYWFSVTDVLRDPA